MDKEHSMFEARKKPVMKDHFAAVGLKLITQAVMRFETEPARQAQVDWKESGKQVVDGKAAKLYAFVMVLGYSRKAFAKFTTGMDGATLLACHALAVEYSGGLPYEVLYDNMRTAFQPDDEGNWKPAKRLCALEVHYGFTPERMPRQAPGDEGQGREDDRLPRPKPRWPWCARS